MRKMVIFAAVALIVATATVWSIATFAKSKVAGPVQATESRSRRTRSLIKQGRNLPVEYWDAF